jgi:hypothetical protein
MMRPFWIVILFLLFQSCANKAKVPDGVLPKEKMREVMWDMIRASEFLQAYVFSKDSTIDKVAESQKWNDKIYQIHKIDKATFERSFAYYKAHPIMMKDMLDTLARKFIVPGAGRYPADSVFKRRDSIRSQYQGPAKPVDSLLRKKLIKKTRPVKPA